MITEERIMILELTVNQHIKDFAEHKEDDIRRHEVYLVAQQQNTEGLKELTKVVSALEKSTRGMVEVYRTANSLQRFVKWIAAFAVVSVVITWYDKLFP